MNIPLIKFVMVGTFNVILNITVLFFATNNNFEWWGFFGGLPFNLPLIYYMKIIKEDNRLFAKSSQQTFTGVSR